MFHAQAAKGGSRMKGPQYCILKDGKEESLLTGASRKQAAEFFMKHHPGEKIYQRQGNMFKGFTYTEVEI